MTRNDGVKRFRLYQDNQVVDDCSFESSDLKEMKWVDLINAKNMEYDLWIIKPKLSEWLKNKVR